MFLLLLIMMRRTIEIMLLSDESSRWLSSLVPSEEREREGIKKRGEEVSLIFFPFIAESSSSDGSSHGALNLSFHLFSPSAPFFILCIRLSSQWIMINFIFIIILNMDTESHICSSPSLYQTWPLAFRRMEEVEEEEKELGEPDGRWTTTEHHSACRIHNYIMMMVRGEEEEQKRFHHDEIKWMMMTITMSFDGFKWEIDHDLLWSNSRKREKILSIRSSKDSGQRSQTVAPTRPSYDPSPPPPPPPL